MIGIGYYPQTNNFRCERVWRNFYVGNKVKLHYLKDKNIYHGEIVELAEKGDEYCTPPVFVVKLDKPITRKNIGDLVNVPLEDIFSVLMFEDEPEPNGEEIFREYIEWKGDNKDVENLEGKSHLMPL